MPMTNPPRPGRLVNGAAAWLRMQTSHDLAKLRERTPPLAVTRRRQGSDWEPLMAAELISWNG